MNGVHDMGGMHGYGKVLPEQNEPVFHAVWEGRVLAMNRALGYLGIWNIDISRHSRERLPPQIYTSSSYYKKWLLGMQDLCVQHGLVGEDELVAGHSLRPPLSVNRTLTLADVPKTLVQGSFMRTVRAPARFQPGDRVKCVNINPPTHTRLPRYARGRSGVVEALRGCQVLPDSSTTGNGEDPQWLYTVVFTARDLWGKDADPTSTVSIDAWEPYLVKA